MGYHTVALHFSETKTSVTTASLCRLTCQVHHGSDTTAVLLVVHHVFQTLVIDGSHKDGGFDLSARFSVIKDFISLGLVTTLVELLKQGIHVQFAKTRSVPEKTQLQQKLSKKSLFNLSNRHARRNRVRIDNEVRAKTILGKGNVFFL